MNNSPFSMGWILAMFDLPVMTDKERKVATRFRNDLLDHGFLMIQFSVYARPCVNFEQLDKHIGIIQKLVPEAGNVRVLSFTDQQWAKSITVIGPNYKQGKRANDAKVPDQVESW
jgi:CRISPR-associated protein Cas2